MAKCGQSIISLVRLSAMPTKKFLSKRIAVTRSFFVEVGVCLIYCYQFFPSHLRMVEQYYSVDDFERVNKIDAHVHYNSLTTSLTDLAGRNNFRLLSINT